MTTGFVECSTWVDTSTSVIGWFGASLLMSSATQSSTHPYGVIQGFSSDVLGNPICGAFEHSGLSRRWLAGCRVWQHAVPVTSQPAHLRPSAAIAVAPAPTSIAMHLVRIEKATGPVGIELPTAAKTCVRNAATPRPPSSPTIDAITPTITASSSPEPRTCLRLAPRARNSPSSFERCATTIENVSKIINEATNKAMAAKISMNVFKKESASATSFRLSSVRPSPLMTSNVLGSVVSTRSRSASWLTPAAATRSIVLARPGSTCTS